MELFYTIFIGHVTYPSSDSKPFLFENVHRLVVTDRFSFSWNKFDHLSGTIDTYNLEEVFTRFHFPTKSRSAFSIGINCSENLGCGCHPIAWVRSFFEETFKDIPLSYSADITIDVFAKVLAPFQSSLNNRPAGVVLRKFQGWDLPIFMLEVHSSPYKNSVSHTAADVLEQLRLLRCFNNTIKECVGFTFPNFNNKTCVTKVTVSFTDYKFVVRLTPLEISDVRMAIKAVVQSAMRFEARPYPVCCFIRLSPQEVREIAGAFGLGQQQLHQVEARHSLVLRSQDTFWKYVPSRLEYGGVDTLSRMLKNRNPAHILLPSGIVDWRFHMNFFIFPAQLPPLTEDEAKCCLYDILTTTATALQELHSLGFAHLDVRLPNICFAMGNSEFIVKLIDLDRVVEITDISAVGGYYGEMYKAPDGAHWSPNRYDWKQLGLLASETIIGTHDHCKIVKDDRVDMDECLRMLIREGILCSIM